MAREIVSRSVWMKMLEHSRCLQIEAEIAHMTGNRRRYDEIWRQLSPLNRKIRNPNLLRVRGIDAPLPHQETQG